MHGRSRSRRRPRGDGSRGPVTGNPSASSHVVPAPGEPAVGWTAWWLQGGSAGDEAEGMCSVDSSSSVDSRSGSICAPPAALVVPLAATTADAAAALLATGPVSVDGSSSSSGEECPVSVSGVGLLQQLPLKLPPHHQVRHRVGWKRC